jgi:hypothetical protein
MKQQTAVEFIQKNLNLFNWEQVFEQAKQMEKEQIMNAWKDGFQDGWFKEDDINAEQYYNETFILTLPNGNPSAKGNEQ